MVDLAGYGELLNWLNVLFWGVGATLAYFAWTRPKGKGMKVAATLLVAVMFLTPTAMRVYSLTVYKMRYAKAKAIFDERCKTAGERVFRVVEDVAGVFLVKQRIGSVNLDDQFKLDDPYGYPGSGEDYIRLFIRGRSTIPTTIGERVASESIVTYRFAEVADPAGDGYIRYTTRVSKDQSEALVRNGGGVVPLEKQKVNVREAKYGITWEDISTREDREHWIAGGSLRIVDLQTGELLGERIGYMFDPGLGDKSGGRSPWVMARRNACPALVESNFYFFDRVIRPKKGEMR